MPFDGSHNASLTDRLAWSGIVPVPDVFLISHKAAEIRKHPESRLWRHRQSLPEYLFLACMGVAIAVGSAIVVANWSASPPAAVMRAFIVMMLVLAMNLFLIMIVPIRLRGPAKWRESRYDGQTMPNALWAIARSARAVEPNARLLIGELIQDSVLLDPYLILCVGEERVCLGIWDGETIIAIATRTEGGSDAI